MRSVGLVFSFVVTLSLVAVALTYVPRYVGQHRIYVQGHGRSPSSHTPYHTARYLGNTDRDTARTAPGDPDPNHQRYYSQSEGWTYYGPPSYSSERSPTRSAAILPARID
jgi:hypothetical protein